ncbi:BAG-associated GRAM protein 1-like protein isoform X1 [Tanacetum coccineum]
MTSSSLLLWNIDTLQTESTPEEHQYVIIDVQFRPNSTQFATASFDNGAAGDGVDDREKIDQLKGYPNGSSAYITKVELLAAKNLIGSYLNGINNAIFVHVNYAARMVLGSSNLMSGEEFNFYMDELPVKIRFIIYKYLGEHISVRSNSDVIESVLLVNIIIIIRAEGVVVPSAGAKPWREKKEWRTTPWLVPRLLGC